MKEHGERGKRREIRYFSPGGETRIPNGIYIQRGGFLMECSRNARKFVPTGLVGEGQGGPGRQGGIVVLPTSACLDGPGQAWIGNKVGAFSVGNAFKGKFVDVETGEEFSAESTTVEIGGLSPPELSQCAACLAYNLRRSVLVKDFNDANLYLADPSPTTIS